MNQDIIILQAEILRDIGAAARIHEDCLLALMKIFEKIPHDNPRLPDIWAWLDDIQKNNIWGHTETLYVTCLKCSEKFGVTKFKNKEFKFSCPYCKANGVLYADNSIWYN